ncbi:MAG: hypothetical protein AB7V56_02470 [Candidatus Nitrosocosmicus sp.]|jgi:hypothetical protein|uniref:hypothetical protein n=1 Tax=Candidatus Nitrosocosmicus agrestis TaxID=2563600 RepID=UPI00122E244F|nr:hypothetical protein [Candidatus Nitrosocosmicus sp. SS]KAA2282670.1 hypothetical protein F1Z66_05055 [Candidatus Nitrosocosmicus sp. SS]KAF0867927.1 hypothetical protein E5N71_12925 [Candidatus Nitrosocosmicus sp. SS]MDR4491086.1 hypothetical protein [Candidatus Nitrosocosmicus sp.]HET6590691.1 hypothetical protein [Candidatus Nitrosocosmicus sp.]
MRKYSIEINASKPQYLEIKKYVDTLPVEFVISGLRFSYNRYVADVGGYLNSGRKSLVKSETSFLTKKQAIMRLKSWKVMVKKFREKGYSYPTIYRIKVELKKISMTGPK